MSNHSLMKKMFIALVSAIAISSAYSQETGKFQIKELVHAPKGKTNPYAVERSIPDIQYDKVFESEEHLERYLDGVRQHIENTRLLKDIEYTYEISETTDDGINLVSATYSYDDTTTFIIFPKPKFDTNDGIEVKFKLKDNNFLGLMTPFNADVNLNFGDEDEPSNYSKVTAGFNISYDYPFNIKKTQETWSNSLDLDWTLGSGMPEFDYSTGLTVSVPVKSHKIVFSAKQSFIRNTRYSKYDDDFYYVEYGSISMPFVIGYIKDTTAVTYTPYTDITYNWDSNGINSHNIELNQTPLARVGQKLSIDRANWIGPNNFRQGYVFSADESLGWDFSADTLNKHLVPQASAEIQAFKAFKYVGFSARVMGMAGMNSNYSIGKYLRGAPDKQEFDDDYYNDPDNNYALNTPGAIVFNFDMPVHIVTTHWLDWGYGIFGEYDTKPRFVKAIAFIPHKLFKYLDFELQMSPFADAGLIKNRATGSNVFYKEGIYTGGLEVLVYPERWKSFVIRASLGIDGSKLVLNGKKGFDSDWRRGSKWEAYFGLGLHF